MIWQELMLILLVVAEDEAASAVAIITSMAEMI